MNKIFAALLTAWNWLTPESQQDIDAGKFQFTEEQMQELTTAGTTIASLKDEKSKADGALATANETITAEKARADKAEAELATEKAAHDKLKGTAAAGTSTIQTEADKIENVTPEYEETSYDKIAKEKKAKGLI